MRPQDILFLVCVCGETGIEPRVSRPVHGGSRVLSMDEKPDSPQAKKSGGELGIEPPASRARVVERQLPFVEA